MFVYTIQPVVKPCLSNRFDNRFDNRLTTGCIVYTNNRFDKRLYRVNGALIERHVVGHRTVNVYSFFRCWNFMYRTTCFQGDNLWSRFNKSPLLPTRTFRRRRACCQPRFTGKSWRVQFFVPVLFRVKFYRATLVYSAVCADVILPVCVFLTFVDCVKTSETHIRTLVDCCLVRLVPRVVCLCV